MALPGYFNVADFVKIGIITLLFVFLANYGLSKVGMNQFSVKA